MSTQGDLRQSLLQRAQELFALCDREGKGYAFKEELGALGEELPLSPEQLEAVFDALDVDGDGQLTLQEFSDGFGMFLGIDSHPRNYMNYINGDEDEEDEDEILEELLDHLGARNLFTDEDYVREMWHRVRKDDPVMRSNFENFISKMALDLKQSVEEKETLQSALKSREQENESRVQSLYAEMEEQLKQEKEDAIAKEHWKELRLRDELETELQVKDHQLQELLEKHIQMEKQLEELNSDEAETKYENQKLQKDRDVLESRLLSSEKTLQDMKNHLSLLRKKSLEEKRKRAQAVLKVSEGIALERENLVLELQTLKEINKQLLDEKDELVQTAAQFVPILMSTPKLQRRENKRLEETTEETIAQIQSDYESTEERIAGIKSEYDSTEETIALIKSDYESTEETMTKIKADYESTEETMTKIKADYEITEETMEKMKSDNVHSDRHSQPISLDRILTEAHPLMKDSGDQNSLEYSDTESKLVFGYEEDDEVEDIQNNLNLPNAKTGNGPKQNIVSGIEDTNTFGKTIPKFEKKITKDKTFNGYYVPSRVFKVVFVGDSGVGKTSILQRFCTDDFKPTFSATIGVDFQIKTILIEGEWIALQLWDTAGQERFRSMTQQYFRKADGIVLVYDVTCETSFKNVRNWMESVKAGAGDTAVILLAGNKIDLCESDNDRVVKTKDGERMADEYGTLFYETSARTGNSIQESMEALACLLKSKEDEAIEQVLKLQEEIRKKKKKCC